ncbi:MAG: DUF488 family protein [Candidatus Eisenbacteria bacterium]|nr:DUF488 domain-containing protein [Candidatus Eisenbacteria bacterium]
MTIATAGHSTRSAEDLIVLLHAHGVRWIADVRTVPRSRRNPQFARETLAASLASAGIGYSHLPGLGGLRHPRKDSRNTGWQNASFRGYADYMETGGFREALAGLIDLARRVGGDAAEEATAEDEARLCLLCAEAVPWRCHRSLIADALTVRGIAVVHILSLGPPRPHEITPFAVIEGLDISYPGLGLDRT